MRTVGSRKIRPVHVHATGDLLRQGALFNDEIHLLPTGNTTYFPKGVYRYTSHEEANKHWIECIVKGIAQHAQ